jgi:cyanophycinase
VSLLATIVAAAPSPALAQGTAVQLPRCGAAALRADCTSPGFDYFRSVGPGGAESAGGRRAGVFLMGGGGVVPEAYAELSRRAGEGRILVLRATTDANADPTDGELGARFVTEWHARRADTLTFRSRAAAYDPRVLWLLDHADGIFIAGGDQANYIRDWKGTPVAARISAHARQGRPLGGSSAGLAVLGHYSYTALDGGSLESSAALAAPAGSGVTLESQFLHVPGLERVITDSHFSTRARLGRLITFVARLNAGHPAGIITGIGIDERTVLLVDGDGTAALVAGSEGSAWVVRIGAKSDVEIAPSGLSVSAADVTRVGPGSRLHLPDATVHTPLAVSHVEIRHGEPRTDALTGTILRRAQVPPGEG